MRNLLGLGIVAVILIGGFIFRDFLSGNAGELRVGQCFDLPASDQETVEDVQHHPCDQAHGGEVIYAGDLPGSSSDAYPSDDAVLSFLVQTCLPAYTSYTGTAIEAQDTFDIGWFQPTADGWKGGDKGIVCYAYRLDDAQFSGSLKAN